MAIQYLSLGGGNAIQAIVYSPSARVMLPNDVVNFSAYIADDRYLGSSTLMGQVGQPAAVNALGVTYGTNVIDTLTPVSGPPLSAIQVGMGVLADGVVVGTYVQAINNPAKTSVTLSQATIGPPGPDYGVIFLPLDRYQSLLKPEGFLTLPGGRGTIRLKPGDVVACDASGWPIMVSGNSLNYGFQSGWTLVP